MNEEKVIPDSHFITLNGQEFELRFRVKAVMAAQKKLRGNNFFEMLSSGEIEALIVCLWASLLAKHPNITYEIVESWVEDMPLNELTEIGDILGKCIQEIGRASCRERV